MPQLQVLVNDNSSRTFLVVCPAQEAEGVVALIRSINVVLVRHRLRPFYEPPCVHVSLCWWQGSVAEAVEAHLETVQEAWQRQVGPCRVQVRSCLRRAPPQAGASSPQSSSTKAVICLLLSKRLLLSRCHAHIFLCAFHRRHGISTGSASSVSLSRKAPQSGCVCMQRGTIVALFGHERHELGKL